MKGRRKLAVEFARMRTDLHRARQCFAGIRILCERLPSEGAFSAAEWPFMEALSAVRLLAVEAEVSLGAAERKGHEALYPPRYS